MPIIKPPSGLAAIIERFGSIEFSDAKEQMTWEETNIVRAPFPRPLPLSWDSHTITSFASVHKGIYIPLMAAFEELKLYGLFAKLNSYGGAYCRRKKRGDLSDWSTHAWGIAIDFDSTSNQLGEPPTINQDIVEIMEKHGFTWGGRWIRPDGMHFQFASDY